MTSVSVFDDWARNQYCYLTTVGRVTGRPHTIENWFVVYDGSAWLFTDSDGGTDWVRNLRRDRSVTLRVGTVEVDARAEVVAVPESAVIRRAIVDCYKSTEDGLDEWARGALVVRVTPET